MRGLILIALAAALSGCMDDGDGDDGGSGGGNGDGNGDGARQHEVTIEGFTFKPASLSIAVGDTVRWTNQDSAPHTATGQGFDTGTLAQGQRGSHTFTAAGDFSYACDIHPSMAGTIRVA